MKPLPYKLGHGPPLLATNDSLIINNNQEPELNPKMKLAFGISLLSNEASNNQRVRSGAANTCTFPLYMAEVWATNSYCQQTQFLSLIVPLLQHCTEAQDVRNSKILVRTQINITGLQKIRSSDLERSESIDKQSGEEKKETETQKEGTAKLKKQRKVQK